MDFASAGIISLQVAMACYLASVLLYKGQNRKQSRKACYAGILLQGLGLFELSTNVDQAHIHVGLAIGYYSMLALVVLAIVDRQLNFPMSWRGLSMVAAVGCLLSSLPIAGHALAPEMSGFGLHFVLATLSYGFFLVALSQMIEVNISNRKINRHETFDHGLPLLDMERHVYRNILYGFIILTLTIASGVGVAILAGKGLSFSHKTLFAVLTWIICGTLLLCRWKLGWRGLVALRWNAVMFACLLMSYLGTITVLDIILQR